jgi:hypothetical protein
MINVFILMPPLVTKMGCKMSKKSAHIAATAKRKRTVKITASRDIYARNVVAIFAA